MKDTNNIYFIRKVIKSKVKDNVRYKLVLETYLNKDSLTVNVEKEDEVIWSKKDTEVNYSLEDKSQRKAKVISLGELFYEEL